MSASYSTLHVVLALTVAPLCIAGLLGSAVLHSFPSLNGLSSLTMDISLLHLEAYQYTPLPPASSAFRLLKLRKGQGPELECELLQQSLLKDEHASYEALSYVWGSSELVERILLDQKRLWVTDNLHSALQCLRLRDRDRFLWIDAICINQADKEEQSQQVRQMGTIYKLAEGVLFWLGKATSQIITLMDALHWLKRAGAEWDLKQSMSDNGRLNDCRTGLQQLLGRPWFTRVWILQEVANAQKGTICCGDWTVPANIFAHAPTLMEVEPAPHCQAVLDIFPGTSRSGSWWRQERDLYTLLCRFQASKATDERDKIYALLGLSSNPLDMNNIDVDYQQSIHGVIQKAISYLMQSTSTSMDNILNIMDTFTTLDTTFFIPAFNKEGKSEVLFPNTQSGGKLDKTQSPENTTQGIAVVNDSSLLLLEARPEKSLEGQETCYSEVVWSLLNESTAKTQQHQVYDTALQVIPWGSVDRHVKLFVIHDRKKAILKAAMHSCGHIVKKLLHIRIGHDSEQWWQWSTLQEAILRGQKEAIHTILQQIPWVQTHNGIYNDLLQEAVSQLYYNSCEVVALLLDWGRNKAQITQEVIIAAAQNHPYGYEIMKQLLDHQDHKIHITEDIVVSVAKNWNLNKGIMALLLDQRGNEVRITDEVIVAAAECNIETLIVLLDRCGKEVQITQEVVIAAVRNRISSKKVIELLLHKRGEEVRITQEVVIAVIKSYNVSKEVIELLLNQRGDEIQVTQDILVAAAENHVQTKDIFELLLNQLVHKTQITHEVLVAAAGNRYGGKEIIALLLEQRGEDTQIPEEVFIAAAGNRRDGSEIITLLLDQHKDKIQVTQKVLVAAVSNKDNGKKVIELLLSRHVDMAQITQEVLIAAAENNVYGREIMQLLFNVNSDTDKITQEVLVAATENSGVMNWLLSRYGDKIQITQEVIIAATGGSKYFLGLLLDRYREKIQNMQEVVVAAAGYHKETLELLLDRYGEKIQITQEVVVAAAGSYNDVLELLLDRRGDEVQITPEVVTASANCLDHKTMELLLNRRRNEVQITQDTVIAAVRNSSNGTMVIELLLNQYRDDIQITQEVVVAAAESKNKDVLAFLLDRCGNEVQITHKVAIAAAENENKDILVLLLNRRGDEVQITQEVIIAAAENENKDILVLLLNRRGDEVQITQEVIIAAARGFSNVLELLLNRRGDEVRITQEVVIAAAGSKDSTKAMQCLHRLTSIDINDAVIQSAAASGQENTLRLFDQWARASIVTETWFDIAGLRAAANSGNAAAVLKLIQRGVPPDTQDMRGITPLWRAAADGHANVVRILLETNAVDVNVRSLTKHTPLFWAAARGHAEVVRLLLKHGAQQNCKDKDGRSPLIIARTKGQMQIINILQNINR